MKRKPEKRPPERYPVSTAIEDRTFYGEYSHVCFINKLSAFEHPLKPRDGI